MPVTAYVSSHAATLNQASDILMLDAATVSATYTVTTSQVFVAANPIVRVYPTNGALFVGLTSHGTNQGYLRSGAVGVFHVEPGESITLTENAGAATVHLAQIAALMRRGSAIPRLRGLLTANGAVPFAATVVNPILQITSDSAAVARLDGGPAIALPAGVPVVLAARPGQSLAVTVS